MKFILLSLLLATGLAGFSQYIGVKARYTDTRLVDDAPNPPKRQNRLVLSFFEVNAAGDYTPVSLTDYPLWIYKEGLQYGSVSGGVLDSSGNNYSGYAWTAPQAVAYYNSLGPGYIGCDTMLSTRYTVNGHMLDCGYIGVSYWDIDYGTGQPIECFTAPNICLPYYFFPDAYSFTPGNVNFSFPVPASPPYNWVDFNCLSGQQLQIRGVLQQDSSSLTLPVMLDPVSADIENNNRVRISWTNPTETDMDIYELQKAVEGNGFQTIAYFFPAQNNGNPATYSYRDTAIVPGLHYQYRVIAKSISGLLTYSRVLLLQLPVTGIPIRTLTVTPNPVINGLLQFQINSLPAGACKIMLKNTLGQVVHQQTVQHNGGSLQGSIPVQRLRPGIYTIAVYEGNIQLTAKTLIQQ